MLDIIKEDELGCVAQSPRKHLHVSLGCHTEEQLAAGQGTPKIVCSWLTGALLWLLEKAIYLHSVFNSDCCFLSLSSDVLSVCFKYLLCDYPVYSKYFVLLVFWPSTRAKNTLCGGFSKDISVNFIKTVSFHSYQKDGLFQFVFRIVYHSFSGVE